MAHRFSAFLAFVNLGCLLLGCGAEPTPSTGTRVQAVQPAPLGPTVGPVIGTVPALPVQYDTGHSPDVASTGEGHFVVFEDAGHIRAVRVDASGAVLDMPWVDLSEPDSTQTYPSVASDGQHYLVTWSDSNELDELTVRGRLVGANGLPEGNGSFAISSGEGLYPAAAWNGSNFVVTWLALAGNGVNDVATALIGASGTKVAGSEKAVSTNGKASRPRVAAGSGSSLVAWEDYAGAVRVIRAAHVAPNGNILDPGGFRLSDATNAEYEVKLAASGAGFLAAWRSEASPNAIRGSIVGDAASASPQNFAISHSTSDAGVPSVAFDGSGYAVAWADGRDEGSVYGARVSTSGVVASTTDTKLSAGAPRSNQGSDATALGWNGEQHLLAFLGHGVEGSLLNANLSAVPPALELSPLPSKQSSPFVTYNGRDYVLAWVDEPDTEIDSMYGRALRISAAGKVLDANGITLDADDQKAFSLGIASAGAGPAVVTWSTLNGDGWLATLSQAGAVSAGLAVSDHLSTSPSIASNGQGYLVAMAAQADGSTYALSARLVTAAGSLGASVPIQVAPAQPSATVLSAGSGYLVSYLGAGNATFLVPVSAAGAVGAPLPLAEKQAFVTSATNGTNTLLVWSDSVDVRVQAQLYANGALQGQPLQVSAISAGYPAPVAWDGENYWIVWESSDEEHRLDARTVSPNGALGPVTRLVDEESMAPSIASDGNGHFILSYYQYAEASRTRRIASRIVDVKGTGSPGGAGGDSSTEGGAGGSDGGDPGQGGASNAGAGGRNATGGGSNGGSSNGGRTSDGGSNTGGNGNTGGASVAGGNSGGGVTSAGTNGRGGSGTAGAGTTGGNASGGADPSPGDGCSLTRGAGSPNPVPALVLACAFALSLTLRRRGRAGADAQRKQPPAPSAAAPC